MASSRAVAWQVVNSRDASIFPSITNYPGCGTFLSQEACPIFCHIHTHICTGNSDILSYLSQVPSRCSLILLPQGILSSRDCSFDLHRPSPDRLVLSQANLKSSLILHLSTRHYCLTSKYLMSDSVSQNPPIPQLSISLASFTYSCFAGGPSVASS